MKAKKLTINFNPNAGNRCEPKAGSALWEHVTDCKRGIRELGLDIGSDQNQQAKSRRYFLLDQSS